MAPNERLKVICRLRGSTGRVLRCATYHAEIGVELRLEYEDNDDVMRSHHFPFPDERWVERMATLWCQVLVSSGFEELPSND